MIDFYRIVWHMITYVCVYNIYIYINRCFFHVFVDAFPISIPNHPTFPSQPWQILFIEPPDPAWLRRAWHVTVWPWMAKGPAHGPKTHRLGRSLQETRAKHGKTIDTYGFQVRLDVPGGFSWWEKLYVFSVEGKIGIVSTSGFSLANVDIRHPWISHW